MKREHFEWLWEQCPPGGPGIVLDPKLLPIPRRTYELWIKSGILDTPFVHTRIKAPKSGIRGLATVKHDPIQGYLIDDPSDLWQRMFRRSEEHPLLKLFGGLPKDYVDYQCTVYRVDRANLAGYVAHEWGLAPEFEEIPPIGYLFGWKDREIPVVVLACGIDLIALASLVIDTKKNLNEDMIWVIEAGAIRLKPREISRLLEEGIAYKGTRDFLTLDGQPKWVPSPFEEPSLGREDLRFSFDWRCIVWNGEGYSLTPLQAAVAKVLYENHENGTPELGQATILEYAGSTGKRLEYIFRGSSLWGTLVIRGIGKGTFRLNIS